MQNLTGLHKLSGFDNSIPDKEDLQNGVCFILDDRRYQVYEDPDDGYRSYTSGVFEEDVQCANIFEPEYVFVVYDDDSNRFRGLKFYSMDGKLIAKIGTVDYEDWYPCAVLRFYPENLAINKRLQCRQ